MISESLWEMKRMLLPSAARFFITAMSSSISWGVKTAVGLVKNQDFVVTIEHFENLGALLHAHGDVLHLGVQIHLEAIALGKRLHLLPRLLLLEEAQPGGLHAQDDIVEHCVALHQLEVLVHHADVEGVGVVGVADGDRLAVFQNGAVLRLVQAERARS